VHLERRRVRERKLFCSSRSSDPGSMPVSPPWLLAVMIGLVYHPHRCTPRESVKSGVQFPRSPCPKQCRQAGFGTKSGRWGT
jgi:hypothetical protein